MIARNTNDLVREMIRDKFLLENQLKDMGMNQGRGGMWRCNVHNDKNNSIHVYSENGNWRAKCHAGCFNENYIGLKAFHENKTYGEICREITGQEPKEYTLDQLKSWKCIRFHEYKDENGKTEFFKIKFPVGSKMPWGSFIEHNGKFYNPSAIGKNIPLYNRVAVKDAEFVFYVEGEKDCNTLINLGFVSVTAGGGANNHTQSSFKELAGKKVYVLMDCDHAGIKATKSITKRLIERGCEVHEIDPRLMNLPEGKNDITDYIEIEKSKGMDLVKSVEILMYDAKPQETARQKYRKEVNAGLLNSYETGIDLLDEIGFIKPRNISTLVGRGGIGKTWLVNYIQKHLREQSVKVSALYLEDNIDFTRDRLISQASGQRNFTDHDWCSAYPQVAEQIEKKYSHVINVLDGYIETKASVGSQWEKIDKWMDSVYDLGHEGIILDPITQVLGFGNDASKITVALMEKAKEITERDRPFFILYVTHPKQNYIAGQSEPCSALIAQGNMVNQASKSMLWFERYKEDQMHAQTGEHYNAFIKVLKSSRTKPGTSPDCKRAFNFTQSATFEDLQLEV